MLSQTRVTSTRGREYTELCQNDLKNFKTHSLAPSEQLLVTEPEVVKPWNNFINKDNSKIPSTTTKVIFLYKTVCHVKGATTLGFKPEIRWVCNRILQLHQQVLPMKICIVRRNKEGLLSILYEESQRLRFIFICWRCFREYFSTRRILIY